MFKKISCVVIAIMLIATTTLYQLSSHAVDEVWDGSVSTSLQGAGTQASPYQITSGADLAFVSQQVASGKDYSGSYFELKNDIILNANNENYASWKSSAPTNVFTPIGVYNANSGAKYFRGNLDGKGYTIYGLYTSNFTSEKGVGLFGATHNNTISNLNIKNSYVAGLNTFGGICGYSLGGTFTNCSFDGYMYSTNTNTSGGSAGGILGRGATTVNITNCYTKGTLEASGRYAGLVGRSQSLNIINSYSVMDLSLHTATSTAGQAGGLLGFADPGTIVIKNSFFAGVLFDIGTSTQRGPVIGYNNGATANVSNTYYLSDSAFDGKDGICKSATDFSDGSVTALLNAGANQTIYEQGDDYPIFVTVSDGGNGDDNEGDDNTGGDNTGGGNQGGSGDQDDDNQEENDGPVDDGPTDNIWDGSVSTSLSGSGTYTDPYLIKNGADLAYISKQVTDGNNYEGKFFSVTKDIALNANSSKYASWKNTAPANSFTPIGKYGKAFKGNINGNGFTIYGMYYSDPSSSQQGVGFISFAYISSISNLNIKNSYLCARNYIGGFAGMAQQSTFLNCSFEGLIYSSNDSNYAGSSGGIIGLANTSNKIEKCYTAGKIDAYSRAGGLIGSCNSSGNNKILSSYSVMNLTGLGTKTTAGAGTGGLVGLVQNGTVELSDSFFAGSYPSGSTVRGPIVAHVVESNSVTANNCYYLSDSEDGAYGENKTADEFKNKTVLNLLNASFDEPLFKQDEKHPIFGQPEPEEPPAPKKEVLSEDLFKNWNSLAADSFDSGVGRATDPYIIKTAEQLAKISADVLAGNDFSGKYFKIANDIVLNTDTDYDNWVNLTEGTLYRWTPIGSAAKSFKGTIDGQGHTISGMYVNKNLLYGKVDYPDAEDMYVGFIGNGTGQISNLHFEDAYVCGFKYVGGIAGQYGGKLTNCSYEGYVRSTNSGDNSGNIGGLVGCVNGSLTVNECYSTGKMNAISRAGGLVGAIISGGSSTISYSYSEMTFDSKIANDGVTPTKSGIGGLLGFAQIGSIGIKTSFYYGNLGVSSGTYGPIIGQIVNGASFSNQGNVFYLEGNKDNGMGTALAANRFNRAGFLSYFTDEDGIVRATLEDGDLHPMLNKTYQKAIDKTYVDYTFDNFPDSVDEFDTRLEFYQKDGFAKNTDKDSGNYYIGASLKNYGCWTNNKDFTPDKKFANGDGYGVGYTARLGGMFASIPMTEIDPDLFYTFTLDAKVIETNPDLSVQIGLFRPGISSGDTAFYDENKNTYDTAIKAKKLTTDKITFYETYTIEISGMEIIEFCEEYSYYPSTLYFGVFSPQYILSEKYRDVYNIAVDNIKIVQSAVPDGYVPASSLPATDILEESPEATYGEHLYNLIENPSFEKALSGIWENLPEKFSVKTSTDSDKMFGNKYLSANAGKDTIKLSIPLKLVKNKFYTFGISVRAEESANYKIYLSDFENGEPLSDIENEEQKFIISDSGNSKIKRHAIYFRSTMKTTANQYLIFEISSGRVDIDEITLTRNSVWKTNRNYDEEAVKNEMVVIDAENKEEQIVTIPDGKTIYDVIN